MRRITLLGLSLLVVNLVVLLLSLWRMPGPQGNVQAQALGGCTLASLAGSYGFSESGTVLLGASGRPEPNGSTRLEFVDVGRSVFDGQGGVTITSDTRSTEGQVEQLTASGTYSVNSDCTGSTSLAFNDGRTGHDAFVVVNGGKEIRIVGTDPGLQRAGTANQQ